MGSDKNSKRLQTHVKERELVIGLQLDHGNLEGKVGTSSKTHGDGAKMGGTNDMCSGKSYGKNLEDQGFDVSDELKCFLPNDDLKGDSNDDTCIICGDEGYLLCCDGCPSTFHQSCLDIQEIPSGDWYCNSCHCKFCGLRQTSHEAVLLTCRSCHRKYHKSCSDSNGDGKNAVLCGKKCEELFKKLEMLLGVKNNIGDGFSWSFVCWSNISAPPSQLKTKMIECYSKLVGASSILKECFEAMNDRGIEIVPSILFNRRSNLPRFNYEGFLTAILEKGDEIISVATIRIHGNELAEMPFIATHCLYRNQGMCRRLLDCIQTALSYLDVELLVIPSISQVTQTWISHFGFEPIDLTTKNIMKTKNLVSFPGTDKLHKNLMKSKKCSNLGEDGDKSDDTSSA